MDKSDKLESVENLSFEQALAELEEIVKKMEIIKKIKKMMLKMKKVVHYGIQFLKQL